MPQGGSRTSLPSGNSHRFLREPRSAQRPDPVAWRPIRKERVIFKDVETDPLWADARELARRYGFRAGWSSPIFSSDRQVLGAFGIYWKRPYAPSPAHFGLIDQITHLASVAIERQFSQEAIRASERLARGQADVLMRTLDELHQGIGLRSHRGIRLARPNQPLDAFSSGVWLRNSTNRTDGFRIRA